MGAHDVEFAGGGGGDDGAQARGRSVAPLNDGREVARRRAVLASTKVPTTVVNGTPVVSAIATGGPAVSGASTITAVDETIVVAPPSSVTVMTTGYVPSSA